MTREEVIEHMKVMGQNAARMDEAMMLVMTRKDCEVVMAAAKLLEAEKEDEGYCLRVGDGNVGEGN